MMRGRFSWAGVLVAAATAASVGGCAMCEDTYDYSPSVVGNSVDGCCPAGGRAGSAISGTVPMTATAEETGVETR
jgi:hypothetical protein